MSQITVLIKNYLGRYLPWRFFRYREIPIYLFCHHKVGTVLFGKVFKEICNANHWQFYTLFGKYDVIPFNADVALFSHSMIDLDHVRTSYTGVHLIRDPRDIIVSGYLYHLRTDEKWCINEDFSPKSPIRFPQVPYSRQHCSEEWKSLYLKSLGGRSYQANLKSLSTDDGLMFEMDHYGSWTIESMLEWNYKRENILELKFEDLMSDFDREFRRIFQHLGFAGDQLEQLMSIASKHDLGRMSVEEKEKMIHVSPGKIQKWKKYFTPKLKEAFLSRFNDVLIKLGYEESNDW